MCRKKMIMLTALALSVLRAAAQDGASGLNEASQQVRGYFEAGTSLMYAVGAILGLVGAVKVFSKFHGGDGDTSKSVGAWFGGCVFLVIVATVIKSFFGL